MEVLIGCATRNCGLEWRLCCHDSERCLKRLRKKCCGALGKGGAFSPALEFLHFSSQPGVILSEAPHRMVQGEAKNLAVSPGPWSTWTLAAVFSIPPIAQVLPVAISRLD